MFVYINNSATSWPKPESVTSAVESAMRNVPPSENRSNYDENSEGVIDEARKSLSGFFGLHASDHVILTSGGTESINLMIVGLLGSVDRMATGDTAHVVTTAAEHNAVLRPLNRLACTVGLEITVVAVSGTGWVDPDAITDVLKTNTRAVVMTHLSNVTGAIQDIESIARIASEHRTALLIDGSQAAGVIPVDFGGLGCDAYAFTGHKGLLGPAGTGGLLLTADFAARLSPLHFGGTGFAADEPVFVDEMPHKFEVGTRNHPGIAGLRAGVEWLEENCDRSKIHELGHSLHEALEEINGVRSIVPDRRWWYPGIVSFRVEGMDCSEVEAFLWEDGRIVCRSGYCCAPLIHRHIGTEGDGVVRFSIGHFNTREHTERAVDAVKGVCRLAV